MGSLGTACAEDPEPAPKFHARTIDGRQFTNDAVKGRIVLFQFWTTWCRYCRGEESLVDEITTEFADKGLIVIAVNMGESRRKVADYLKNHPRKCHVVLMGDTNVAAALAATALPTYVVVGRDGNVFQRQRGAAGEGLRWMIESAFEGKEPE